MKLPFSHHFRLAGPLRGFDRLPKSSLQLALTGALSVVVLSGCTLQDLVCIGKAEEIQIGSLAAPKFLAQYGGLSDDAETQKLITQIGGAISSKGDRPDLPWHFYYVNSSQVNAFALPGGHVFVFKGLVDLLHKDDGKVDTDELAGVIGHEISHCVARHGVRSLINGRWADLAEAGMDLLTRRDFTAKQSEPFFRTIVMRGYSREFEEQADHLGAIYAARAGYGRDGLLRSLRKLGDLESKMPDSTPWYLRTHPYANERVAALEKELPALDDETIRKVAYKVDDKCHGYWGIANLGVQYLRAKFMLASGAQIQLVDSKGDGVPDTVVRIDNGQKTWYKAAMNGDKGLWYVASSVDKRGRPIYGSQRGYSPALANELMTRGEKLLAAGQPAAAVALLRRAENMGASDAVTGKLLARAYRASANPAEERLVLRYAATIGGPDDHSRPKSKANPTKPAGLRRQAKPRVRVPKTSVGTEGVISTLALPDAHVAYVRARTSGQPCVVYDPQLDYSASQKTGFVEQAHPVVVLTSPGREAQYMSGTDTTSIYAYFYFGRLSSVEAHYGVHTALIPKREGCDAHLMLDSGRAHVKWRGKRGIGLTFKIASTPYYDDYERGYRAALETVAVTGIKTWITAEGGILLAPDTDGTVVLVPGLYDLVTSVRKEDMARLGRRWPAQFGIDIQAGKTTEIDIPVGQIRFSPNLQLNSNPSFSNLEIVISDDRGEINSFWNNADRPDLRIFDLGPGTYNVKVQREAVVGFGMVDDHRFAAWSIEVKDGRETVVNMPDPKLPLDSRGFNELALRPGSYEHESRMEATRSCTQTSGLQPGLEPRQASETSAYRALLRDYEVVTRDAQLLQGSVSGTEAEYLKVLNDKLKEYIGVPSDSPTFETDPLFDLGKVYDWAKFALDTLRLLHRMGKEDAALAKIETRLADLNSRATALRLGTVLRRSGLLTEPNSPLVFTYTSTPQKSPHAAPKVQPDSSGLQPDDAKLLGINPRFVAALNAQNQLLAAAQQASDVPLKRFLLEAASAANKEDVDQPIAPSFYAGLAAAYDEYRAKLDDAEAAERRIEARMASAKTPAAAAALYQQLMQVWGIEADLTQEANGIIETADNKMPQGGDPTKYIPAFGNDAGKTRKPDVIKKPPGKPHPSQVTIVNGTGKEVLVFFNGNFSLLAVGGSIVALVPTGGYPIVAGQVSAASDGSMSRGRSFLSTDPGVDYVVTIATARPPIVPDYDSITQLCRVFLPIGADGIRTAVRTESPALSRGVYIDSRSACGAQR